MLQWTRMCRCLYCNLTYIPLGILLRVVLLDHMSVLFLVFFRILHTIFHSGCTNLHFHQQCMSIPFSPHLHQHLLLFVFLMVPILTGVKWNLNVVLIAFPLCWAFFYVFFCHLDFYLCKSSVQFIFSYFHWIFYFGGVYSLAKVFIEGRGDGTQMSFNPNLTLLRQRQIK
jgi:hypothetical protein